MKKTIDKIVKETIDKLILSNKKLMLEYSISRGEFKQKIDDRFPQILENLCLVNYCSTVGQTAYKKHWQDELRGYLLSCSRFSIKKNDSLKTRKKVLFEIIEENDFNNIEFLNLTVANKFLNEGIDISSEEYFKALTKTIESLNEVIEIILSRDSKLINSFAYGL